jgi:hypothetical protein
MGRVRRAIRKAGLNRQVRSYLRSARGKLYRFEVRLFGNSLYVAREREEIDQADLGSICWIDHLDTFGEVVDIRGEFCDLDVGGERVFLHRSDVSLILY